MVHFVGAGPGATDLITVRGQNLLKEADVIIYAGSLVNKEHLNLAKEGCGIYNSASMTLEEVIDVIKKAEQEGKMTVRLHTGDPSICLLYTSKGRVLLFVCCAILNFQNSYFF